MRFAKDPFVRHVLPPEPLYAPSLLYDCLMVLVAMEFGLSLVVAALVFVFVCHTLALATNFEGVVHSEFGRQLGLRRCPRKAFRPLWRI